MFPIQRIKGHKADLIQNHLLEKLIVCQESLILRNRVFVFTQLRGNSRELLQQLICTVRKHRLFQEPLQQFAVLLLQDFQQCILQRIAPGGKVFIAHITNLAIGQLGELVGHSGGIIGTDVQLTLMLAITPDILVGIAAQAGPQISDGSVREAGIVILAGNHFKVAVLVHAIEIDGMIQVMVQRLKVSRSRNGGQIQHGIVVSAKIEISVVDPHIAGHGIVDAKTEGQRAAFFVAGNLGPDERFIGLLVAAVQSKALLVGQAGLQIGLVGHHRDIKAAVVSNDVPDAAAVQAIGLHHSRQAVKVILIGHNAPLVQTGGRILAAHNDAAGVAVAVIVVGGKAHENLIVKDQQAVNAVRYIFGLVDVIVNNLGLIGHGVDFHQRCGRGSHAGKIQLVMELKRHAVAAQGVKAIGEHFGMLAPDLPLTEDNIGLARVLVHRQNDRRPILRECFVKGVHPEHHAYNVIGNPARIHIGGQQAAVLHLLQAGVDVVVVNIVSGIVAGPDVNIIPVFGHRPGIALATLLRVQNAVQLRRIPVRVGDFFDGIAAQGVNSLGQRLVIIVPVHLVLGPRVWLRQGGILRHCRHGTHAAKHRNGQRTCQNSLQLFHMGVFLSDAVFHPAFAKDAGKNRIRRY